MALVAGLQRHSAVGGRRAGAELSRLGHRAAGQLGAADARREAEVVLDPPRRARLAAEGGALDDQRLEALGGAVDGGAEAGRPGADDEQVDLLARQAARARRQVTARPGPATALAAPRRRAAERAATRPARAG